ncbi:FkbM family methyltransferase [Bradyrhizobium genosp. L]|uniref:FkbM family methyltransferase n=1 Tax=Bradyrhizobium genosp. L TaxID=83637 RepID=UPI001FEDFF42|nr:FkbM family methyltransferase [Bradyrhizobium genosp. L]
MVCDIGANKGSFTYWLSRWNPAGRVIAFEPQKDLAGRLAQVCSSARLRNVLVEPKAVAAESGIRELCIPDGHQSGASLNPNVMPDVPHARATVTAVSLDEYFYTSDDRISVLKIDVEGVELDVLRGAARILQRRAPLLVFECENRHLGGGSVHDVFAHLEAIGYRGRFALNGRLHPIEEFDAAIHQRQVGEWFWKQPGYCNNFVFAASR